MVVKKALSVVEASEKAVEDLEFLSLLTEKHNDRFHVHAVPSNLRACAHCGLTNDEHTRLS